MNLFYQIEDKGFLEPHIYVL